MNEQNDSIKKTSNVVEAILFISGEPLSIKKLSEICEVDEQTIERSLEELSKQMEERGLRLLKKDEMASLVTAPEATAYIEKYIKEEVMGDLTKAALETMTVIAYKHPISRPEIDYIRGVNSAFTLRNLIMRGLVERVSDKKSGRMYFYRPTIEFMKFMGLARFEDLPHFTEFRRELDTGVTLGMSERQEQQ